ncbi:hypothetical protein [Ketogulonicigenium vulgare]|uniref:hypothetical protein n=1 Tax=Ketogulonicigenium vulgare TaxID=92945 RepID=UPI002358D9FD|nr:hypothetical protein [Ketogulonicigenium vulgare]
MTLPDLYPLAFLGDLIATRAEVTMTLQRYDEMSGGGDGRRWAAELAPPLWTASFDLNNLSRDCIGRARGIDARFRALGTNRAFLWADPTYSGPAQGVNPHLVNADVRVAAFSADRTRITFSGLPAGFEFAAGDRFSAPWGTGRYYLGEIADGGAVAGGSVQVAVYPYPPLSLQVGAQVELLRPVCRMFVPDDGYTPYSYRRGSAATGASVTMLEKR